MSELAIEADSPRLPVGEAILVWALLVGAVLGAVAKLLGGVNALVLLGQGVAVWVSAGFLFARRAAKGRDMLDATVWAGTTMAVYLGLWLLGYCAVFGVQQSSGFAAAWLDERVFFIIAPAASAIFGLVATASWRSDWIGDAFLAAPIAWSLPEVALAASQGWLHVATAAVPALVVACIPLAMSRSRRHSRVSIAAMLVMGGAVAFLLITVVQGRS